jgi:hypothetical protein
MIPAPQRTIAALILGIIMVILLVISGTTAWFSVEIENSQTATVDYTLEQEIIDSDILDDENDLEDLRGTKLDDVGDTTGLLVILGIIFMIIVLIFVCCGIGIYYMRMHRYNRLFNNLALLFCLLAIIFVLLAPIYYMAAWTEEMKDYDTWGEIDTFIGSDSTSNYDVSWGPGIGWILAIFNIFMMLVILLVVKLGGLEVSRLAPYAPPSPRPQYAYTQPPQYYQPYPPSVPLLYYPPNPYPQQPFQPPQGYYPVQGQPQFKPPAESSQQPGAQSEPLQEIPKSSDEVQPTPSSAAMSSPSTPTDDQISKEAETPLKKKEKLSTEEKLKRLKDRFLKGEISEKTYLEIKGRYESDLNPNKAQKEELPKSDEIEKDKPVS